MTDEQRAARVAELWELRHSDPIKILAMYRRVAGLDVLAPIPPGLAFSDLIDAIVGSEAKAKGDAKRH